VWCRIPGGTAERGVASGLAGAGLPEAARGARRRQGRHGHARGGAGEEGSRGGDESRGEGKRMNRYVV
jgi:hypothetical protein